MTDEPNYAMDGLFIGLTLLFIILNGFFVAAEFALVKLSGSKIKTMVAEDRAFAGTAQWLYKRQNMVLSACQLGITMASLALGWIGEPAIGRLIEPLLAKMGVVSETVSHTISFIVAFSLITALHIVIGEQVPKIYAIRKPTVTFLRSATILKLFYYILIVPTWLLNSVSTFFLKKLGIEGDGHDTPLSEEEIRASLSIAHAKGELTKNEHRLLNAVFKFDDEVARHIMQPRGEIEYIDINKSYTEIMQFVRDSRHSRFPLCDGGLDNLIGVVHIKDFMRYSDEQEVDLKKIARTAMRIPEHILIGKLLQEFRLAKQHFAFVEDEHGTVLGIVTLEDVLEELVGNLEDEFDEPRNVQKFSDGSVIVSGNMLLDDINMQYNLSLSGDDVDTLSGLIVEKFGHKLKLNYRYELDEDVEATVLKTEGIRAVSVKLKIRNGEEK